MRLEKRGHGCCHVWWGGGKGVGRLSGCVGVKGKEGNVGILNILCP